MVALIRRAVQRPRFSGRDNCIMRQALNERHADSGQLQALVRLRLAKRTVRHTHIQIPQGVSERTLDRRAQC